MSTEGLFLNSPSAGKIRAQAQQPMFVYRLLFREPIFNLDDIDDSAVGAAFQAFRPWNVSLENIKVKEDAANFAEEATEISLLGGRVAFIISPGGCSLVVANANWAETESILAIAGAGVDAVLSATGMVPDRQLGSITMHLTPERGAIADITSKFVKIDMSLFGGGAPQSVGFSIYREEFLCVVDRSVAFPNSLFVRWDRWFKGDAKLDELAHQLNSDERKLLDLLGLEVD
jgi:hypothetical protein